MTSVTLIEIALIFVIIAWNAFFVSAEYAFVAVRRTRIDELVEEGSVPAKRVRRLLDDPARFISASARDTKTAESGGGGERGPPGRAARDRGHRE